MTTYLRRTNNAEKMSDGKQAYSDTYQMRLLTCINPMSPYTTIRSKAMDSASLTYLNEARQDTFEALQSMNVLFNDAYVIIRLFRL